MKTNKIIVKRKRVIPSMFLDRLYEPTKSPGLSSTAEVSLNRLWAVPDVASFDDWRKLSFRLMIGLEYCKHFKEEGEIAIYINETLLEANAIYERFKAKCGLFASEAEYAIMQTGLQLVATMEDDLSPSEVTSAYQITTMYVNRH